MTNRRPAPSITRNVRLEWPPSSLDQVNGPRSSSMLSCIHCSTAGRSKPGVAVFSLVMRPIVLLIAGDFKALGHNSPNWRQPWRRNQVSTEMATAVGCSGSSAWPALGTSTTDTLPPSSLANSLVLSADTRRSSVGRTIRVSVDPPDAQASVGVRCWASSWAEARMGFQPSTHTTGSLPEAKNATATDSRCSSVVNSGMKVRRWAVAGSGLAGTGPGVAKSTMFLTSSGYRVAVVLAT